MVSEAAARRLLRSTFLEMLYGGIPALDDIELIEVVLERDGPTLLARFTPLEAPKVIPEKWRGRSVNAVSVTLRLSSLQRVEIIRFERSSLCKLSLDWSGDLFELELTGAALVSARAEFCDVDTITGYMRGGDR